MRVCARALALGFLPAYIQCSVYKHICVLYVLERCARAVNRFLCQAPSADKLLWKIKRIVCLRDYSVYAAALFKRRFDGTRTWNFHLPGNFWYLPSSERTQVEVRENAIETVRCSKDSTHREPSCFFFEYALISYSQENLIFFLSPLSMSFFFFFFYLFSVLFSSRFFSCTWHYTVFL